jgi:thioredoxin reductase
MPEARTVWDVAVIGAGPAGIAAALSAADAGCTAAVLDLSDRLGGQYWKWGPVTADGRFHHHWRRFVGLRDRFVAHQRAGRIVHLGGHEVFLIRGGAPFEVHAVADERRRDHVVVDARSVVVATGAYDRHVPFPGWTLPGVMAAGGAQALLKTSAVLPGRRVVVAGSGPFLLSVAAGLLAAGAAIAAVVEAGRPSGYLRQPAAVAGAWPKLFEGAGYLARLLGHRVPILTGHAVIAAHGEGRLSSVSVARVGRDWEAVPQTTRTLTADVLAVGFGFVPQVELLAEAGARLRLSDSGTLASVVDDDQETTVAGLFAAGETTGVGGADLALAEGRIAGRGAARRLGRSPSPSAPITGGHQHPGRSTHRRDLGRRTALRRFAALMEAVHPVPPGWIGWSREDTVVCRCEEVDTAQIRSALSLGADDARSLKLLARPGMGWCQGRICGAAVAALIADHLARPVEAADVEAFARRPLAQPVPLAILGRLADRPGR